MESDETKQLKEAIMSELKSLKETRMWEIVDKPRKVNFIYCKWVLKKNRT